MPWPGRRSLETAVVPPGRLTGMMAVIFLLRFGIA